MPLLTLPTAAAAALAGPLVAGLPGFSDGDTRASGAVATYDRGRTAFITPQAERAFDRFGAAVARADFDRDGELDLAIGAPGRDVDPASGAEGAVFVRYADGEVSAFEGPVVPQPFGAAAYGSSLAAGDLDGDGYGDLAVGAVRDQPVDPDADKGGSGTVHLLFGGPAGLSAARSRVLTRPRIGDIRFGSVLALGDVDLDGRLDLVEGAAGNPNATDGDEYPGHLSYCPGGPEGPLACRPLGSLRGPGPDALAIGDVTAGRRPDVVAGFAYDRYRREDAPPPTGAVRVYRGTPNGAAERRRAITQRTPRVPGRAEGLDGFGSAVAIDGHRLLIGAPGEDRSRGSVTILRLRPDGRVRRGARRLEQGARGVRGHRRPGDRFGAALALVRDRLAVGAPGERNGLGSILLARARDLRGGRVLTLRGTFDQPVPRPHRDEPYDGPQLGGVLG